MKSSRVIHDNCTFEEWVAPERVAESWSDARVCGGRRIPRNTLLSHHRSPNVHLAAPSMLLGALLDSLVLFGALRCSFSAPTLKRFSSH